MIEWLLRMEQDIERMVKLMPNKLFRVITFNANGIRSAAKKGFFDWTATQNADVICVQELKAHENDLKDDQYKLKGYHRYLFAAQKKGYSGVGIYTRHQPNEITPGLKFNLADEEGRHLTIKLGDLYITSLYLPSGTSGDIRQQCKYDFLNFYQEMLLGWVNDKTSMIICGDFNIAHKEIDLKNWRSNQKNSGFLPKERAWMDYLFNDIKYVDCFREINTSADQYTWWSNRGQARAKNVGWRIDYQITTPDLKGAAQKTFIYKDQFFSDHAPLIIDYLLPSHLASSLQGLNNSKD